MFSYVHLIRRVAYYGVKFHLFVVVNVPKIFTVGYCSNKFALVDHDERIEVVDAFHVGAYASAIAKQRASCDALGNVCAAHGKNVVLDDVLPQSLSLGVGESVEESLRLSAAQLVDGVGRVERV